MALTEDALDPAALDGAFDRLRTHFQPIVALDDRHIVGYEALTRGPQDTPLERPDLLFDAVRRVGRVAELDWACQAAALRTALNSDLRAPQRVFINVEPESGGRSPVALRALYGEALKRLDVVLEVTERALTTRPAELLQLVCEHRELGCRIALDDVGADPRSLAMMAFLAPDVIKLDLRLVQSNPSVEIAAIVAAVNAQAEQTGAQVLVEGIETEEHHAMAVAMGASFGQGWLFGRPAPLGGPDGAPAAELPSFAGRVAARMSPFELVRERRVTQTSTKPLLFAMSKHLENQAAALGETAVLLATFEDDAYFTAATRERYARMAGGLAFCGALARGIRPEPAAGVRGTSLTAGDPLAREWDVAVVSPHFAGALIARDLGDTGPDVERRFEYVVTYDRELVVAAASALMARMTT